MYVRSRLLLPGALALTLVVAGCGDDDDPTGPRGSESLAVGAAFPNLTDDRIVLVNKAGTRYVYFDMDAGSFSAPGPISDLEAALPLTTLGAVAHEAYGGRLLTYYFDARGDQVAVIDRNATEPRFDVGALGETALVGAPFDRVGAGMNAGPSIYFFDPSGMRFSVYVFASASWGAVSDFPAELGGGDAPIPAVGAACRTGGSTYILFSSKGDQFTIYELGEFSEAFDIGELGDGTLAF